MEVCELVQKRVTSRSFRSGGVYLPREGNRELGAGPAW